MQTDMPGRNKISITQVKQILEPLIYMVFKYVPALEFISETVYRSTDVGVAFLLGDPVITSGQSAPLSPG
jgi:hypothetical protein